MTTLVSVSNLPLPDEFIKDKAIAPDAAISVSKLAQRNYQEYPLNLLGARVWDDPRAMLPSTPASDDLGIAGGTFGSASPSLSTGDLKAAGSTTRYARFFAVLPPEYVAGESVRIRVHTDMTVVADTAATIDVSVYKSDENAGVGSDLCSTAAQDCNSATDADYDFTIDGSGLSPGDVLDLRIAFLINDAATGTPVTGTVGKVSLMCDTKG